MTLNLCLGHGPRALSRPGGGGIGACRQEKPLEVIVIEPESRLKTNGSPQ